MALMSPSSPKDPSPHLLALDFDGVICDGMREYFQTSLRTYEQLWQDSDHATLNACAENFYTLRPLIESGWEMPLLLRSQILEIPLGDIRQNWSQICPGLLRRENLNKTHLTQILDRVRDQWIAEDPLGWLHLHRFYPGVIDRLRQLQTSSIPFYIVTTKEGRFVRQLLQEQGVAIAPHQIIGKEIAQSKSETLRQLKQSHQLASRQLWFVEDLLKTLEKVNQQPDLSGMGLFLADWGYNTAQTRAAIANDPTIHLLSLAQFSQDFPYWLDNGWINLEAKP